MLITKAYSRIRGNQMGAEIYAVTTSHQDGVYVFTKFDNDYNKLQRYLVSAGECNCPRGETGKTCRHRDMLRGFIKHKKINNGWLWNHSTQQWIEPPQIVKDLMDERAEAIDSAPTPAPEPQVLASAPVAPTVSGAGVSFRKRKW